ncbi:DeoR/GlpR family DNA-binding transcription regulator [Emticicia sp. 21SJ11W-3]|uniref:DeoR/GlpR family DNA-binding transcription regulator n=1 Tax=Emticicia sp. 21SJ11W-3 TaxID=2916755 RepID=UPI00209F9D1E|nr:DeoR/GlpR family DNA-binding transcription regulator [Emticicia sp. 21SJ11W-3]UTA66147.1 DeoR/GlpR family DNA-binding transcription regulator [Emticicia sp. 21SJ11W-3]
MNFQERKHIILEKVEESGSADVKELAVLLNTSEITVRRDLAALAEKGLIYRTHGGAMKISLAKDPVSFINKSATRSEQKDHICQIAASFIQEGDVVFLDCGSTVYRLCPFIRNMNIKVVTNSIPVVNALLNSAVSLNFAGGEIDMERQASHGTVAIEHFARYRADKAFIGVDGISIATGLSASSEKEAEISTTLARYSRETFLLCDSTKLEKDKYLPFAPLTMAQYLITDKEADAELMKRYESYGIRVLN